VSEKRKIYKNASVFDSKTGIFNEKTTMVISGNKFEWVGSTDDFTKNDGDEIIDLSSKYVLPGLIDCHIHLQFQMGLNFERDLVNTQQEMFHFYALQNAQKHLAAGFTTVRDVGAMIYGMSSLKRVFHEKLYAGPRLVIGNKTLHQWGRQENEAPEFLMKTRRKEIPSGKDGMIHTVRENKHHGSDVIKIEATGGVLHGLHSQLDNSFLQMKN